MENRKLMASGIAAFVVAALCCSTPILAVLLGAVGLSAVLGYLQAEGVEVCGGVAYETIRQAAGGWYFAAGSQPHFE